MTEALQIKYRPTTIDEVVGQDHIKEGIKAALSAGKQQAFLLEGPSGTGKTTLARICAKELGCAEVIEIDAASHTGVDAMREVASRANFVSFEGGGKAIIVDECHRLSRQAWESLLKDIEEPPQGVYWFFCTTEGAKVIKAVRTRCISWSLKDVPWRKLLGLLKSISDNEGLGVSEEILDVCAEEAGGSPRQAIVNLASVTHATTVDEARAALNRMAGDLDCIELARLIIKKDYSFKDACSMLNKLQEVPAETIRHTVRAYVTKMILSGTDYSWVRGVLMAFEKPCEAQNQVSDILCRLITLEKWKRA